MDADQVLEVLNFSKDLSSLEPAEKAYSIALGCEASWVCSRYVKMRERKINTIGLLF
ncbi:hypothetical protein HanRHA438_Chr02g0058401 [Helianthus annuus]|nr:hypothetical protein HanRHA438_Chr02g0058401 [Helianthus annuus]